jgi:mono/diheme cytochrome c family protein
MSGGQVENPLKTAKIVPLINLRGPVMSLRCTPLFLLLLSTPALAQGDPEAGRDIVRRWCTACHVVEPEGTGADAGPPLPALLAGKQRSADEIRGWLADPHPPMPNFNLSRQEIDDILAYLESLTGD